MAHLPEIVLIRTKNIFIFVFIIHSFIGFAGWKVFDNYDESSVIISSNELQNSSFEESGSSPSLTNWEEFELGYSSSAVAHSGTQSLMCVSETADAAHGGYQTVTINQTTAKPILISCWSKAENVTGNSDAGYSFYVDITYTNGEHLWGETLDFSTGTHNWEYRKKIIFPLHPVQRINCYCLFRWSHTGTVWFDDAKVQEIESEMTKFDDVAVVIDKSTNTLYDYEGGFELQTDDGLRMTVASNGAVIAGLVSDAQNILSVSSVFSSGWLVCDRGTTSGWHNFGGKALRNNNIILQTGSVAQLGLSINAQYIQTGNCIRCVGVVSNIFTGERALTVYFALPTDFTAGDFWIYQNEKVKINDEIEIANLKNYGIGARDYLSVTPLASITKETGLTFAIPPDKFRPFRIIYNRYTKQFYVAFDICLSSLTEQFPNSAEVEVLLFNSNKDWGFRSGLEKYYQFYHKEFQRTFTNEGIWVAFADLRPITNIFDFHIAYHETSSSIQWKSDDTRNINSYRYLLEPWSYWMDMPTNLDNTSYTDVTNHLYYLHKNGTAYESAKAETVLSSGVRTKAGGFMFDPAAEPWCPYGAVFYLSASPYINDLQFPITKYKNEWNAEARAVYDNPSAYGYLDGEYMDSFDARDNVPNYYTNYLRVTTFPLTYLKDDFTPMSPMIFSAAEAARAIKNDLNEINKPFIANGIYLSYCLPVGIGIFDFCGAEINLLDSYGNLVYPSDKYFSHFRLLSGRKPYGFLLNTDFNNLSYDEMELYMKLCAGYGFYPSAFSHNAASDNYFETPDLYERDRNLFKKYVPIIIKMNNAGWQPVTGATSDFAGVVLEKFGLKNQTKNMFLSMRNLTDTNISFNVTFSSQFWGSGVITISNWFATETFHFTSLDDYYTHIFALSENETKVFSVQTAVIPEISCISFFIFCCLILKSY